MSTIDIHIVPPASVVTVTTTISYVERGVPYTDTFDNDDEFEKMVDALDCLERKVVQGRVNITSIVVDTLTRKTWVQTSAS